MIESRMQILEARMAQVEKLLQDLKEELSRKQATPIDLTIIPFEATKNPNPLLPG